ncbi:hypothetical protein RB195_007647 [Necator americanus]|uniref:Uncharacterized protein n=1 Tax=Necator americanus TaxID=51031 RepID=A0ABR1C0N4_NECAM
MKSSGLLLVVWLGLTTNTVAVDVARAILHPRTFEDSLCIYVVAIFVGGWITLLTFVFSYWLYFRAPVPQYTYQLVTGGCVPVTPDIYSGSEGVDRAGVDVSPRDHRGGGESVEVHPNCEPFVYAEQATQQVSLGETPTQEDYEM